MTSKLAAATFAASVLLAGQATAAGDPGAGKAVFASQCGMCHTATKGGPTLLGPNLYGIVGRPAASVKGYNYSPAMKATGFTWTSAKLKEYLPAPAKMVPGNKMPYGGLQPASKVDDVLAFLDTLK